ncbi:hypothetical protein CLOM_g22826 [Closterium sp. NIES-68]|nr:hypothetical protein CLOM_g22826 [Closterium sp. NIES-68]GJP82614.1 hypothetical protein CLOP_g12851 [Closterium sp. NIES-67]
MSSVSLILTSPALRGVASLAASSSINRSNLVLQSGLLGTKLRSRDQRVAFARQAVKRTHVVVATQVITQPRGDFISSIVDFLRRLIPDARQDEPSADAPPEEEGPMEGRRRVMVVGGTGRVGRHIVSQLVAEGYSVVALVGSEERAAKILGKEQGLQVQPLAEGEGVAEARPGKVHVVLGDINDSDSVQRALRGADAVVCAVGIRVKSRTDEGGFPGYEIGSTPEDVYGKGVPALIRAAEKAFGGGESEGAEREGEDFMLFDFRTLSAAPAAAAADGEEEGAGAEQPGARVYVDGWGRFDDVIMGGISESVLRPDDGKAVFEGTLRVEGGGFCASRTSFPSPLDLSAFDGLHLRVKGDGRRYKLNLRDEKSQGEFQYQASFDTLNGQWLDAFIPFSQFRAVERSRSVLDSPPINAKKIRTLGIVYSRFQCDGFPNPLCLPGDFSLEIASISAYRASRPQVVLVSSAAVQRSARAVTPEERSKSIPIVQLNPGGVLSWKLSCEDAVRASGLRYTVVRPTGLLGTTEAKADTVNTPHLLESGQGDVLTGLISCPEAAAVCVKALDAPDAVNTTFEVRRDELTAGLSMEGRHWADLFGRLRPDVRNGRVQYPAVPKAMSDAFKG